MLFIYLFYYPYSQFVGRKMFTLTL